MPLVVTTAGGDRELAPEGEHNAVIAFVLDLGEQVTPWGTKQQVAIGYELAARTEKGERFHLTEQYSATLWESKLKDHLEGMLGRPLTDAQIEEGVDLEKLVGYGLTVIVAHKEKKSGGMRDYVYRTQKKAPATEKLDIEHAEPPDWLKAKVNLRGKVRAKESEAAILGQDDPPAGVGGDEGFDEVPF